MRLFEGVMRVLRPQESGAGGLRLPKLPLRESESQSLIRALSACASSYEPIDSRASLLTVAKYRSGNLLVEKRAAST